MSQSMEIERAKYSVRQSAARLEAAIDQLEKKIEGTAREIEHVKEVAQLPKKIASELLGSAMSNLDTAVSGAAPYINQAQEVGMRLIGQAQESGSRLLDHAQASSRRITHQVRENPEPYVRTFLVIAAGIGLLLLARRAGSPRDMLRVEAA